MDKTILNLLLNYTGTITYREFRIGTAILLLLTGTYISSFSDMIFTNAIAAYKGTEWIITNTFFTLITQGLTPSFLPVWFIVSFSSFVLAIKRIKALNNNRKIAILSGIINYLFFASFITLLALEVYQPDRNHIDEGVYGLIFTPITYMSRAFLVIGAANLIYLCIPKKSEKTEISYQKGRLDVVGYSNKISILTGITFIASITGFVILKLLGYTQPNILLSTTAVGILGLFLVVPSIFYIKYSIYRLKDARISILWLIGTIGVYAIISGLKIWTNLHSVNPLTLYFNTLFQIATSLFILGQYILFLLPTKNDEQIPGEEQP